MRSKNADWVEAKKRYHLTDTHIQMASFQLANTASNPAQIRDRIYIMKCTQYFSYMIQRPDRAVIKEEWVAITIKEPIKTVIQTDGRIRKWRFIKETGKYLRIILLEDGETVHNAFFDRSFEEE